MDILPMENDPLAVRAEAMTNQKRPIEVCWPELDSVGDWFIGFGTSILHGHKIRERSESITIEHAMDAARAELFEALEIAPSLFDEIQWEHVNHVRRDVFALMVYQLGPTGVRNFKNTIKAINNGDYERAADEMLDSKWARNDSPRRAACLAHRMRGGVWSAVQDWRK